MRICHSRHTINNADMAAAMTRMSVMPAITADILIGHEISTIFISSSEYGCTTLNVGLTDDVCRSSRFCQIMESAVVRRMSAFMPAAVSSVSIPATVNGFCASRSTLREALHIEASSEHSECRMCGSYCRFLSSRQSTEDPVSSVCLYR